MGRRGARLCGQDVIEFPAGRSIVRQNQSRDHLSAGRLLLCRRRSREIHSADRPRRFLCSPSPSPQCQLNQMRLSSGGIATAGRPAVGPSLPAQEKRKYQIKMKRPSPPPKKREKTIRKETGSRRKTPRLLPAGSPWRWTSAGLSVSKRSTNDANPLLSVSGVGLNEGRSGVT